MKVKKLNLIKIILGIILTIAGLAPLILGVYMSFGFILTFIKYTNIVQFYNFITFLSVAIIGFLMVWFGLRLVLNNIRKARNYLLKTKRYNKYILIVSALILVIMFIIPLFQWSSYEEVYCEEDIDCKEYNCNGLGPWYCDRDGSSRCDDNSCQCLFGCL